MDIKRGHGNMSRRCQMFWIIIWVSLSSVIAGGSQDESPLPNPGTDDGPAKTKTFMLPGNTPLEMVWIEPGTFMMGRYVGEKHSLGREAPQHEVTLTHGFWMGKYELTKAQWEAVMGTTPWSGKAYVSDEPKSPAVYVSWNDAQEFITALKGLTGKAFRLPTEAEWEYAYRAETKTRFYWGDDSSYTEIGDYAWWRGNVLDADEKYARRVGQKLPNAWGLYDMGGNVWEWCNDWYGSYSIDSATDPAGPSSGSGRVVRGGSWHLTAWYCRAAPRSKFSPDIRDNPLGLRLSL